MIFKRTFDHVLEINVTLSFTPYFSCRLLFHQLLTLLFSVGICVGPYGDGPKMCENVESFSYVRASPRNRSPNTPVGVLKIISSSRLRELVKKLKSKKTSRLTRTDKRLLC